jgi:hypothetical protein
MENNQITDLLGAKVISRDKTKKGFVVSQRNIIKYLDLKSKVKINSIDVNWNDGTFSHGVPAHENDFEIASPVGILFRPHRGWLDESMNLAEVFATMDDLKTRILGQCGLKPDTLIQIEKYSNQKDCRNGWDTCIVLAGGAPVGFTHGFGKF